VTTPDGERTAVLVPADEWQAVAALAAAAEPTARNATIVRLFGEGIGVGRLAVLFGIERMEVSGILSDAGIDPYPIDAAELEHQVADLAGNSRNNQCSPVIGCASRQRMPA
jgi:predicted HTH domain antitoxin